jgi:quercetin dioxygenase-like cupin family protein
MRRTMTRAVVFSAAIVWVAAYAGKVQATPASGFVSTTLALGRFGDIDVSNYSLPDHLWGKWWKKVWLSLQKTQGPSDLYVQSNVWEPGGSTGWHTHPGHSLITVTAGSVTAYEGDDPSCAPHVYTQGMGIVDPGGGHVHVLRNEGSVEARTITVQVIPADATRRVDAEGPAACPF